MTTPSALSARQVRRNLILGVLNGTLMRVLDTLASPALVLTWFVTQLGGSAFAVGLLIPIANGGWFLPQLFMSRMVQPMRFKLPLYRAVSAVRVAIWALMVGIVFLIGNRNPGLTLMCFLLLYTLFCFGAGISGLPWLDVVAKAIPLRQRGSFFGWRDFSGGILAIGASVLVRLALDERRGAHFPLNFGLLFIAAGLAGAAGYYVFGRITEPEEETDTLSPPVESSHWRAAWRVPLRDSGFRVFLSTRVTLAAATVALPFYALYAKERLGAPGEMAGVYSAALTLALVVSTLLWGRLSDRRGNRVVLQVVSVGQLLLPLLPLLLGRHLSYLSFTAVFALVGIVQSGSDISLLGMGLELAPPAQRSLYLGMLNTTLGVVSFVLILGGWIATRWGLESVFLVSAALALIAILTVARLPDPRRAQLHQSSTPS